MNIIKIAEKTDERLNHLIGELLEADIDKKGGATTWIIDEDGDEIEVYLYESEYEKVE